MHVFAISFDDLLEALAVELRQHGIYASTQDITLRIVNTETDTSMAVDKNDVMMFVATDKEEKNETE